jgi:hypothetical protein
LSGIEDVLGTVRIRVTTARGPKSYRLEETFIGPGRLLVNAAIQLEFGADKKELLAAAEGLGVQAEDVSLVVLARDVGASPLKETVVVAVTPLIDLDRPVVLTTQNGQDRARPMRNRHNGFGLVLQFVLNSELPPKPLAPYLKGTILAAGNWEAQSSDARSGLQPRPLTREVRQRHFLPNAVWFFVEKVDSYLESSSLQEALVIYVDENYLRNLSFLPPQERRLAEHLFIVPALVAVTQEASRELQGLEDDGRSLQRSSSAVLGFLHQKATEVSADRMPFHDFVEMLKTDPGRVVSMVTATNGIQRKLLDVTESLAGGEE